MTITDRSRWGSEEYLDFLDGWHEATDPHFKTARDKDREVRFAELDEDDVPTGPAVELMAHGRTARENHRAETGL